MSGIKNYDEWKANEPDREEVVPSHSKELEACSFCNALVPEFDTPPYSGHKPRCDLIKAWKKIEEHGEMGKIKCTLGQAVAFISHTAMQECKRHEEVYGTPAWDGKTCIASMYTYDQCCIPCRARILKYGEQK